MGAVVTGKAKPETMMQQSPGICKVFAMKGEQVNEKGDGCPLGKQGNRTKYITHTAVLQGKAFQRNRK